MGRTEITEHDLPGELAGRYVLPRAYAEAEAVGEPRERVDDWWARVVEHVTARVPDTWGWSPDVGVVYVSHPPEQGVPGPDTRQADSSTSVACWVEDVLRPAIADPTVVPLWGEPR